MKKITPSLEINFEQFGKAASLPGLLLARDLIDEQIRMLRGDIQEPEEALETLAPARPYQKRPPGRFIPGVRVSMRGLHRGTDAYRAADAHNKQVARDNRETYLDDQGTPIPDNGEIVSIAALSGHARAEALRHNARIYARRRTARLRGVKVGTKPLSSHESGAVGWAGMNAEERSKEMMRRRKVAAAKKLINAKREDARSGWAKKTPAQKKKWLAAITAGKERAAAERAKRLNGAA